MAVWDVLFTFVPLSQACMMTLAMMVQLELPHISAITKIDLVDKAEREKFEEYIAPSGRALAYDIEELNLKAHSTRFRSLNRAIGEMLDDYSLVSYIPIRCVRTERTLHRRDGQFCSPCALQYPRHSVKDESTLERLTMHIDRCMQYVVLS